MRLYQDANRDLLSTWKHLLLLKDSKNLELNKENKFDKILGIYYYWIKLK